MKTLIKLIFFKKHFNLQKTRIYLSKNNIFPISLERRYEFGRLTKYIYTINNNYNQNYPISIDKTEDGIWKFFV